MAHHIDPDRAHFEAFKALPRDTPILMLNLIRLRAEAAYPDGRGGSGKDAYAAYGARAPRCSTAWADASCGAAGPSRC